MKKFVAHKVLRIAIVYIQHREKGRVKLLAGAVLSGLPHFLSSARPHLCAPLCNINTRNECFKSRARRWGGGGGLRVMLARRKWARDNVYFSLGAFN